MQDHYSDRMKYFANTGIGNDILKKYDGLDTIILDKKRNQFYDEILKQCKGKRCVDVGSGSGLLAFIALKHGAEHVTCIEQDEQSCKHIKIVSKRMGIPKNKIRVIHDEFRASRFDEYNLGHVDIIFHEIVGSYIWNEMIGNTFDVPLPGIKILPSEYKIEFSILGITEDLYKKLIDHHNGIDSSYIPPEIDLGIELSDEYNKYYDRIIRNHDYYVEFPFKLDNIFSFHKKRGNEYLDFLYQKSSLLYTSLVNINSVVDVHDAVIHQKIKFDLPKTNKPYLLLIHPYMIDGDCILDWKDTSSFRGYRTPMIVPPNCKFNSLEMTLNCGQIDFYN